MNDDGFFAKPADRWMLAVCVLLVVIMLIIIVDLAMAQGPADKWGQDAATQEWFRGLHAPTGIPCCDYADGNRIEDPDYAELPDHSYDVRLPSGIVHVEPDHVVQGTNRVGYAIYWGRPGATYCFMPGARG